MRGLKLSSVALIVGLTTSLISGCGASGESAQTAFVNDLKARGFSVTKISVDKAGTPGKPSKRATNPDMFEAVAPINGCNVEFERATNETKVVETVNGRKIKRYVADEVNDNGERDLKLNTYNPGPAEIAAYLKANKKDFPCYTG